MDDGQQRQPSTKETVYQAALRRAESLLNANQPLTEPDVALVSLVLAKRV